jgi:hypothetical protein
LKCFKDPTNHSGVPIRFRKSLTCSFRDWRRAAFGNEEHIVRRYR